MEVTHSILLGKVVGHRTLRQRLRLRKPWERDRCYDCGHTYTSLRWPMYLLPGEIREGGVLRDMLAYALPSLARQWRPAKMPLDVGGTISIPYIRFERSMSANEERNDVT